jgi:ubiquinone/menaquinone biosynthesis C-methylase UbiE
VGASASSFSGSIPEFYDRLLGPVLFEPYAVDLAARLPQGEALRVLELACGTGIVTRRLRESLDSRATLVATDLNEPMLVYASTSVPNPGITWQQGDAQALPFAEGSFDAVVCQFGFMFLPDKPQGFREARRVLAPGGVLLANVWHSLDANPPAAVIHATSAALFPSDPPLFMRVPYGYHDQEQLASDMIAGGWEEILFETLGVESIGTSAEDFARGFARGSPLTHELVQRGADLDEVTRAFTQALVPVGGERPFKAALSATVITATRTP